MRIGLSVLLVIAASALFALAEQAPMSPEARRTYATHILTGKVGQIYERRRQHGKYRYVQYVAEVTVDAVEKGEGPKRGDLVYVRYWTKAWTGPGHPSPGGGGQTDILPKEGERLRFYIAVGKGAGRRGTTDKGYEVANPKGGLVIELRLARARTTKDVDLRLVGSPEEVLEHLQEAGRLDLGEFMRFEVRLDRLHPDIQGDAMKYDGYRFRAECRLAGKSYGRPFGVDVAFGDPVVQEPDA